MPQDAAALSYLDHTPSPAETAAVLPQPLRLWLSQNVGLPTPVQCRAWPALAAGKNLLLCAPTGSGKSLAAFLPILGDLLSGPPLAGVRCLYVSPLKALGTDAASNLRTQIEGIRSYLPSGFGNLRVGVRTGDTSAEERREQRLDPPEFLLTTPESLAVLLSQPSAHEVFANLRWVIVDEVHALVSGKRGADLCLSLERLAILVHAEIQRIGLSATCAPAAEVAAFLCGIGRSCSVAVIPDTSSLELTVEPLDGGITFLADLVRRLEPELRANRSTLIFANTRSLSERTSWALRRRYPDWEDAIAVHHSALAPGRRREIEANLKAGRLRAVVCSTSLELGIDIGFVDGVVLVHPPGDVVRLLQRVGRSGHGPGLVRRGLVLTGSPGELLEAAVTMASGRAGECEPLCVPVHPLDVLCQQLLGMAAAGSWTADEAFALVQRAYPYHTLSRENFSACLAYLSGQRSDSLISGEAAQWLPARLSWNGAQFRILDERTARLLRRNLGTILAEEPRSVRLADDTIIGEVEDRFAERLNPGDRFLLDGRCLEYRRNGESGLIVEEVLGRPQTPRWTADGWPLSLELARRLYLLRVRAAEALRGGSSTLTELLRDDYGLADPAVSILADYFERQERVSEVPDAATFLVERVVRQMAADYYLHTPLNRYGNDALARVIMRRLGREGRSGHSLVADLGLLIALPGPEIIPEGWRRLLCPEGFAEELTAALAEAPALRQRFGKVAQTGLMVLRNPLGHRQRVGGPSWTERRLFDKVRSADPGFVLLKQAEREVRDDVCDARSALLFAQQLVRMTVRCRSLTQPSPFVESWSDVTAGPTEELESPLEALQRLHAALMGNPNDEALSNS